MLVPTSFTTYAANFCLAGSYRRFAIITTGIVAFQRSIGLRGAALGIGITWARWGQICVRGFEKWVDLLGSAASVSPIAKRRFSYN